MCTRLSAFAAAAALEFPGLVHLHLHDSGLGLAAVTALLTAAVRPFPPTLRSMALTSCSGDVAAAVVAVAAMRSLTGLVMVDRLIVPRRHLLKEGPPLAEACAAQVALLGDWNPHGGRKCREGWGGG